jgi:hypothetical protein
MVVVFFYFSSSDCTNWTIICFDQTNFYCIVYTSWFTKYASMLWICTSDTPTTIFVSFYSFSFIEYHLIGGSPWKYSRLPISQKRILIILEEKPHFLTWFKQLKMSFVTVFWSKIVAKDTFSRLGQVKKWGCCSNISFLFFVMVSFPFNKNPSFWSWCLFWLNLQPPNYILVLWKFKLLRHNFNMFSFCLLHSHHTILCPCRNILWIMLH